MVRKLKQYMNKAAKDLDFELAAKLRDKVVDVS
jgi:excinuclease UvrABC helicase subunit UvrB